MRTPPSHRYCRLRSLDLTGNPDPLVFELVSKMGLPGYVPHSRQMVQLLKAPAPRAATKPVTGTHLSVVLNSSAPPAKKKGRPPKAKPLPWLESGPKDDSQLDFDDFLDRYALRQYLTDAGRRRVHAACLLWSYPIAREFTCAYLLQRATYRDVLQALKKACPDFVQKHGIRQTDIEAFHELLWDFSAMGASEVVEFLEAYPGFGLAATAANSGLDAFLYRMGMDGFDLDRVKMLRSVQRTAFLEIDKARRNPKDLSAKEFAMMYKVLVSAMEEEDRYTKEAEHVAKELFASAIETYDAAAIPRYSELLDEIESSSLLDDIAHAEKRGVITESFAELLRQKVRDDEEIDLDTLLQVRSASVFDNEDDGLFGNPLDAVEDNAPSSGSPDPFGQASGE